MDKLAMARKLISSLGETLTVRELSLDETTNSCVLIFDGDLVVNLEFDEPTGALVFSAYLDELPEQGAEPILRELMAANLYWHRTRGATLALEEGTGGVILTYRASVAELDPASTEACLENFVKTCERWGQRIASLKQSPLTGSALAAAAVPGPPGGGLIYG